MNAQTKEQEAEMPTEVVTVDEAAEPFVLVGERCDANASGSEAATVRVWVDTENYIHLCQHHYRKHKAVLVEKGYLIQVDGELSWG